MQRTTKPGNLSADFMASARVDEEGSLAYMIVSAFGISLQAVIAACLKMQETNNTKVAMMCLAAGVQIRNHVVYVGPMFANMRNDYPDFIIEGIRPNQDIFNFSALHIAGHVLSHFTTKTFGTKILSKAGDCVLGTSFPDNEAGKINKDLSNSWTPEEKQSMQATKAAINADMRNWIDNLFDSIAPKADTFGARINPAHAQLLAQQRQVVPIAAVVQPGTGAAAAPGRGRATPQQQ